MESNDALTPHSFPKNKINVLLLENIHPLAVSLFRQEGYNVETHHGAMDENELAERIEDVFILGIRSKTQITEKVLRNAKRLLSIGAFCIGTNQIDLTASLRKGVAVFNAPFSNTRSVVELALGEIILLHRNIFNAAVDLHSGKWNKTAQNSHEIRGKKLGIIGYGNIGSQLSVLAESMGMRVYYFDIDDKLTLGNAQKCSSLDELLSLADVITVHVDGRPENNNLIGEKEFRKMQHGVIFLNLSRGHVVDILALKSFILSGKIRGAAVDVYPEEPKGSGNNFTSELQGLPNTILTPHIAGSTEEAQEDIAGYVPDKLIQFINTGSTSNSVNFPHLQLPKIEQAHRLIHIHHNVPGVLAKINSVLAKHEINIMGQYLKTNDVIGYAITAVDKMYDKEFINEMRNIEHTIKFRVLY
jgi:D-3-phosphoglycerate dehydrogenase